MSATEEQPQAGGDNSKVLKSLAFFGLLAAVVGVFFYLSNLEPPPDLPNDSTHKFRFNTEGELVGLALEAGAGEPEIAPASGLELDKKAMEARVNQTCISCHSEPGVDLTGHICQQTGKCVPAGHPPKNTCIKCHRH